MTCPSDGRGYYPAQPIRKPISAVTSDGRTAPSFPFETVAVPMRGRPTGLESQRRKGKFLALMAAGADPVDARKQAGIAADRALRIVTDSSYAEVVKALQEELAA